MYIDNSFQQKQGNRIAWIVGLTIVAILILLMVLMK
jgi:hypothetical protein